MKRFIKWRILLITAAVCLLPILLGVLLWEQLPDRMAIHFDLYNQPDRFSSKAFVVFGLPVLMVLLQFFCCFVNDINAEKHGTRRKFELATKWIIPVMTIVLQAVTLGYNLGLALDIRKVASVIVGVMFLFIGNYLPKFDYIKDYDLDTEKARKINRFIGFETVVMGILFLLSNFLPPMATILCLILLVPYAVIGIIYGVRIGKQ